MHPLRYARAGSIYEDGSNRVYALVNKNEGICEGHGGLRAIYEGSDPTSQRENDLVYTSPALARRIVEYLNPQGFCVDPCRGRGAFYDAFDPENRDWCEIREGRDFLTWAFDRPVDWCITNPPFSEAYAEIAARAFSISENVAF